MDLAAREAAVAATRSATAPILIFVAATIACAPVDNTATTVGAFSCAPTTAQINTFHTDVFQTTLIACTSCHNGSNGPPFLIASPTTDSEKQANLCAVYARGQLQATRPIYTVPQSSGHPTVFPESALSALILWVETTTL